jgi:hypothetical protein
MRVRQPCLRSHDEATRYQLKPAKWKGGFDLAKDENGFGMTGMAVEPVDTRSLKISGTNRLESITGVGEG